MTRTDNIFLAVEVPSKEYTNNEWYTWDRKLLFIPFDHSTKKKGTFNET